MTRLATSAIETSDDLLNFLRQETQKRQSTSRRRAIISLAIGVLVPFIWWLAEYFTSSVSQALTVSSFIGGLVLFNVIFSLGTLREKLRKYGLEE